jgi:hypothetical protein
MLCRSPTFHPCQTTRLTRALPDLRCTRVGKDSSACTPVDIPGQRRCARAQAGGGAPVSSSPWTATASRCTTSTVPHTLIGVGSGAQKAHVHAGGLGVPCRTASFVKPGSVPQSKAASTSSCAPWLARLRRRIGNGFARITSPAPRSSASSDRYRCGDIPAPEVGEPSLCRGAALLVGDRTLDTSAIGVRYPPAPDADAAAT